MWFGRSLSWLSRLAVVRSDADDVVENVVSGYQLGLHRVGRIPPWLGPDDTSHDSLPEKPNARCDELSASIDLNRPEHFAKALTLRGRSCPRCSRYAILRQWIQRRQDSCINIERRGGFGAKLGATGRVRFLSRRMRHCPTLKAGATPSRSSLARTSFDCNTSSRFVTAG